MKPTIAFLISPLIVSLLVQLVMGGGIVMLESNLIVMVPVIYFFTLVLAVPSYLALPRSHKKRLLSLLAASFVVAFVAFALMNMPYSRLYSDNPYPHDVFIPGGWLLLLRQCFLIGLAGAGGGLCFWLITRERHVQSQG